MTRDCITVWLPESSGRCGLDLLIVTANRAPVGNCTTEDVTHLLFGQGINRVIYIDDENKRFTGKGV